MQDPSREESEPYPPGEQTGVPGAARNRYAVQPDDEVGRDRLLGRTIAAKSADPAHADELEQEARFLARLDHAGCPTVLDFVRDDGGAILITRRIDGIWLSDAIAAAAAGQPPSELATPANVAQLLIRLCEAVAAAHAQEVVHRRLDPRCIRLGCFGQVQVCDWHHAIAERQNPATLRYVSSAVRNGRLGLDGLQQDIQALGSVFFACLVLRRPQPLDDDVIGKLEPAERERLPAAFEAIIRRAIASDAASGYATASAMADDIARCLAGQAPRAQRISLAGRALHAVGKRVRPILVVLGVVVLAATAAGLIARRQIEDWLAWRTVAHETFTDAGWKERWLQAPAGRDAFETRDGAVVSTADREAMLILRRRLATPVAIEYTGQITPGSQPCDLSVLWSEAPGAGEDPARFGTGPRDYMIQAGAFGNAFCAIFQNPGRELLAHSNRQLQPGREYRFRVDIMPDRLRMSIDGDTVLDYAEDFPTRSGHLSLFGFYPGKAFRDVRVLQRSDAGQTGPLDAGDDAFVERHFTSAALRYAQAAELATGTHLSDLARFKRGLAEWNQGDMEAAGRIWAELSDEGLKLRAACYGLDSASSLLRGASSASAFETLWRERPDLHPELLRVWLRVAQWTKLGSSTDTALIERLLTLQRTLFPGSEPARFAAATILVGLRRHQECLDRFPDQRLPCSDALLCLGRPQEVLDATWTSFDAKVHALTMLGDFTRILGYPGVMPEWRARVLCKIGRAREAVDDPAMRYPGLIHAGRAAELLRQPGLEPLAANEALIALGRLEEAAGPGIPEVPGSGGHAGAMLLLGRIEQYERATGSACSSLRFMQAVERGDRDAAAAAHDGIAVSKDLARYAGWFMPTVAVHVIDALSGDAAAVERIRQHLPLLDHTYGRRGWHVARAVLGDTPPDGVLAMTTASEAAAWRAVAAGMRAELQGDADAAIAAYAAFAGLPTHQRLLAVNTLDGEVEWYVDWRLRTLRARRR